MLESLCYNVPVGIINLNYAVTHTHYPLRLNVGFLFNQPIGTYRDFSFDFPDVELSPDFVLRHFKGLAHISRTPQGLLVEADFSARLTQECVRCLEDYEQDVSAHFTELFAFRYRRNPESDLFVPDDGYINLAPLAYDYLMLELPIKPICRLDCKGLCVVCGENLNFATCEHHMQVQEE